MAEETGSAVEYYTLQLPLQQVANHLASRHPRGRPQSREVQSRREGIGVSEEKHRRNPATRVLEREAGRVHLVLLNVAAAKVVHGTCRVDLGLESAGHVSQLRAGQDVEVIVGSVAAGVAFSADGCAEDDEIFSNAWEKCQHVAHLELIFRHFFLQLTGVDNIHGTHGATGIVEDPFLVKVHVGLGGSVLQVGHDIGDNGASVVAMLRDCALCEVVQLCGFEDVEALKARLEEDVDTIQQS